MVNLPFVDRLIGYLCGGVEFEIRSLSLPVLYPRPFDNRLGQGAPALNYSLALLDRRPLMFASLSLLLPTSPNAPARNAQPLRELSAERLCRRARRFPEASTPLRARPRE